MPAAQPSPPAHPPSSPHAAEDEARTAYHLALLRKLIDQGMDLAGRLHAEATAAPQIPTDLIERHTLVARGIRHAIALESWLARTRAAAHAAAARTDATEAARQRTYLRHRIDSAITAAGGRTFPLRARLEEHIANPGLDAEFARRPFDHIVAGICRDLGIPPPAQLSPPHTLAATAPPTRRPEAPPGWPEPDAHPAVRMPDLAVPECSTGPP